MSGQKTNIDAIEQQEFKSKISSKTVDIFKQGVLLHDENVKISWLYEQLWQWPYEALGIVDSGLYDITILCGPKDMSLEK